MVGLSLGSAIMLLPQFITPPSSDTYRLGENSSLGIDFPATELLCYLNASSAGTTKSSYQATNPIFNKMKYVFYLANVINGVSSVALYTIVISYIEGMFNKEQVIRKILIKYQVIASENKIF